MNWIILYAIAFLLIVAILTIGYFINYQARVCFNTHKEEINSKELTAKDFAHQLCKHNKLKNIAVVNLRAKKTNYYSAKYNVIKVAPDVANSSYMFDLAICAKCTNRAIKQQYNYISSTLKFILTMITKTMSMLFVPIIFVSAILNISFGLEKTAYLITLISIICYLVVFIIQLILYILDQSAVKNEVFAIKNANILEKDELKTLEYLLIALNKFEFFEWTRLSLKIFTFLNPATFFDKNQI